MCSVLSLLGHNQSMVAPYRHITMVVNPHASFGKHHRVAADVVTALEGTGRLVTVLEAPTFELLQGKLRHNLVTTPDLVIAVGGDGMVSLVINELAETSIPFTVMPTGTGNDFARGVGCPVGDVAQSLKWLLSRLDEVPTRIDLGRITDPSSPHQRWFACVLSAGFDAKVNERANKMSWPKGKSRYTWALLRELVALRPVTYQLTLGDRQITTQAVLISVANNTMMGGGMRVTPSAFMADGLLDLFILAPLRRVRFLRLFPRVFAGTHVNEPEVSIQQITSVTLDAPGVVAYADGERVFELPIHVEIVPGAIRALI
jgi:diacylglycerol kinase (ATP)